MSDSIPLTVEFLYVPKTAFAALIFGSGGLDALFSNQRKISLSLPAQDRKGRPANMDNLIHHLYEHYLTDHRKDFFVIDDSM